jgi:protein-tyrosine phosphatase
VAETRLVGVLFVCTGNICRSPTAEGVFRAKARTRGVATHLRIDSAGTHDYHVGEAPDARAVRHAERRGYDLSALRARQVSARDFHEFDHVLAMDRGHLHILRALEPAGARARVALFHDHSLIWRGEDVPDPYYGGAAGFDEVLDRVEETCERLLEAILSEIRQHPRRPT